MTCESTFVRIDDAAKVGYDAVGRKFTVTYEPNQATTFPCDAVGNMATRKDFNGKATMFGYDSLNRMLSKTPDAPPPAGRDPETDRLISFFRAIDPSLGCDLAALDRKLTDDAGASSQFRDLLGKMAGKEWLPYALRLFGLTDRAVLLRVGTAVGYIQSKSVTRRLLEILKTAPLPSQREAAALALGQLADKRAAFGLRRALSDEAEQVRDMAAEALQPLASMGYPGAVRALLMALGDRACAVRWSAAWALGCARDESVAGALELLLDDRDSPPGNSTVAEVAAESIKQIRDRTRRPPCLRS